MIHNISRFIAALALLATAQTAGATETSTITVGSTDYTLFTGFTATGGNGRNYAKLVDGNTTSDWSATKNDDDPNAPANDFAGGTADPAFVEFHADEAFIPKGYVLTCYHEDAGFWKPVQWALKAKLDEGDAWTTIQSSTTTLGQGKTFEIACDNDGDNQYQYFRFEVYEVGTTDIVDLDELQFYGSLPAYTHLTVKAATCMATGIKVDCYRRNSDGKYFTDNTGETEIPESDVIAPIIPHTGEHHEATDVNIEYWQCSMCGKYFSDEGCTTEITKEQTKIYRTITIDSRISGLVTLAFSETQALAGTTMYINVSDLIDASTLKVNNGAVELTAENDIQYSFTMPAADVTVTAEVAQSNADGDVLTGSIRHTVTITNGANITLSDATITGSIVCEGSATITLVGTNSVSGANQKAGIQIGGSGTTLTIKGDGSLTANGGSQSAGIGLSRAWKPANDVIGGDIVIEGGNITANGGTQWGAGIGTGVIFGNGSAKTARIGDITIKGGTVKATGGTSADGIGTGYTYSPCTNAIGTVTIYDGIDKVDASSIKDFANVVYMHGETNVTASKTDYFAIGEDGNRRLIAQKPAIDEIPDQSYTGSEITPEPTVTIGSLTLTKGTDYVYSYTNNTNVGTATVTVTFQGDYESLGSVEKEFTIVWSETATDEYTIHNAAEWNVFCDCLNDNDTYNRFSGKTVRLDADITVTRMAGSSGHAFTGTFDGGGHTLTLAYGTANAPIDAQFVAPFVETANDGEHQPTFRNLTIAGSIYDGYTGSEAHNIGGLIGHLYGTVTIEHCTSLVEIHAKVGAGGFVGLCEHSVSFNDCHSAAVIRSADGSNSGFVAWSRASAYTIAFTGCLFDGKLLQQNGSGSLNGGFIGWTGETKTVTFTNCLCAPAPLADGETMASSGSATFARGWNATTKATNSYYTAALGDAQGKAITTHTVTAGTDVTIGAIALTGTATQYTVSGITAYSGGGLQLGQTLYYGSGDQLSLTLSNSATGAPLGYQYGYTASAGTLSGNTLTMPDQDVTISVNTATLAAIDWATVNEGDSAEDPYMIYNKDQLLLLAHRMNGTNGETAVEDGYYGKYFKLGANITFSHDAVEGDDYAENYEAIGSYIGGTMRFFKGDFDGDGHTVSGIRIRKDGSGIADYYQGLFGCISSGADIHDVHLTDARITGCQNVGGIAGLNNEGYIRRCSVTDSYIAATGNWNYGTICGRDLGTLTNNYYHGCTVNSTAVTSGKGCQGADITANNGALPAYAITLGANITTPPRTFAGQTEWLDTPPDGARLAPENGFTLAGNHYFASGYEFTPGSTLASGAAQGYTPRATLGDVLLDLYTPTGDPDPLDGKAIARLTITADCDGKTLSAAIRSDGQQHDVSYMTADGTTQTAQAVALDGTETNLAAGWYFVGKDIDYANQIRPNGDVNLILVDGKTMTLNDDTRGISGDYNLTIYGQSLDAATAGTLRYNGKSDGIHASYYEQHSGNVSITTTVSRQYGIYASDVILRGGTLTVSANGKLTCAINVNTVSILGGQLDATATGYEAVGIRAASSGTAITLGWTRPADRITASSISAPYGGTVAVKDGQALTDGSGNIYTGTLTVEQKEALAGKTTLQPWLVLNETDGVTPLTALAGQADVPVIFTRSGLTANAYSTMCLPFGFEKPSDCTFYEFKGVGWSTANKQWEATISETSTLAAHTPYIFKCSDTEATFIGTIASVPTDIEASLVEVGASEGDDKEWKFKGTYTALDWTSAAPSEPTYGFSTYVPAQTIAAGTFVRFVQGASLAPFRARLIYSGSDTHLNARTHSRAAQAEGELPRYIIVRIIGANGSATAIGTLDTATGQLSTDEWYTLGGRRLEAKPSAKGIYIHNGKKVAIK